MGELLVLNQANPHFVAAVASSLKKENLRDVFAAVLSANGTGSPAEKAFEQVLSMAAALGEKGLIDQAVETIAAAPHDRYSTWQLNALGRLVERSIVAR